MASSAATNNATLIGKLTRDPELRRVTTRSGEQPVLTLGLAVRRSGKQQDGAPSADFFDVNVWGPARGDLCGAPVKGSPRRRLGAT